MADPTGFYGQLPDAAPEVELVITPDQTRTIFPPDAAPEGRWSEEQKSRRFYSVYQVCTRVQVNTGKEVLVPAAEDGTSGQEVKLRAASAMLTVMWKVGRLGSLPKLPHWDFGDPNCVVRYIDYGADEPVLQGDGETLYYRFRGLYVYALKVPPGPGDRVPVPTTAVIQVPSQEISLSTAEFDRTLLAFVTASGGGQ